MKGICDATELFSGVVINYIICPLPLRTSPSPETFDCMSSTGASPQLNITLWCTLIFLDCVRELLGQTHPINRPKSAHKWAKVCRKSHLIVGAGAFLRRVVDPVVVPL